ncbi:MarR family transcriptional regulator [Acidianus sp. RZ1]|uniref:MarR family transcriptional regulator n=1 Tax=Acidianus sp. RZ1 TaxID=1540082 RepID=UPI0014930BE8|nr:MarR family transcriptional regulator [Acidianus sp. RZ1]NON62829.1 MarR family transcriptional regulator [Acidianus sp. RZ1]
MDGKKRILDIIKLYGQLPQTDLVRLSGISKSRTSEILTELEKNGIIIRKKLAGKNLMVSFNDNKFLRIGIIRAAEYPFIMPFIKNLEQRGFYVQVRIYDNGIDVTRDISLGKIDMGFSPVISQIIFSKVFGIKIIAGGARGGAGIVGEPCKVGSTVMSSMELWTMLDFRDATIVPFSSPKSLIDGLGKGDIKAVAIWEPYLSILESKGNRISHIFDPIHCCTLAIRDGLDEEKIKTVYENSFSEFMSSKERWISSYANLLGEDYQLLEKASKRYVFDSYLDINEIYNYLKKANVYLPS